MKNKLTEKESKFFSILRITGKNLNISEHILCRNYINNCKKVNNSCRVFIDINNVDRLIDSCFIWNKSIEGIDYWEKIDNEFQKLLRLAK